MRVDEALIRLGGVADSHTLVRVTSRRRVRTAHQRGEIVRVGRGWALPNADEALKAASRLDGVASHLSAARHWGWKIALQPERPSVIVPRNRKVEAGRRRGVDLRWRDLPEGDVVDRLTSQVRTVIDCARDLPFLEALAVTDSALRDGVDLDDLVRAGQRLGSRGRAKALRVINLADGRAANPFESALRALALEAGLDVEPQVEIVDRGFYARPDLVDAKRRLVIEADSFEFHSSRKALRRDCRRYTALALRGWVVIRFSWEDVFLHPDYTRECLSALTMRPEERAILPDPGRLAA